MSPQWAGVVIYWRLHPDLLQTEQSLLEWGHQRSDREIPLSLGAVLPPSEALSCAHETNLNRRSTKLGSDTACGFNTFNKSNISPACYKNFIKYFHFCSWLSMLLTLSGLLVKFLLLAVVSQQVIHKLMVVFASCCTRTTLDLILLTELFWMHCSSGNGCSLLGIVPSFFLLSIAMMRGERIRPPPFSNLKITTCCMWWSFGLRVPWNNWRNTTGVKLTA